MKELDIVDYNFPIIQYEQFGRSAEAHSCGMSRLFLLIIFVLLQ